MCSHQREVSIASTEPSIDEPLAAPGVRKRPRAIRGRRGGLASMPKMPLDVIYEILGCLHPRDVLSLARASKEWREMLMNKKNARLWKAARTNVDGLPDCPPYLSEPAYANLMFMKNCHRCLKSRIRKIVWMYSVRYCSACAEAMTVSQQEEQEFETEISEYHQGDIVDERLSKNGFGWWNILRHYRHSRPHFEALKAKWDSLPDEVARAVFLVAQVTEYEGILKTSKELERWLNEQDNLRKKERENLKEARLEAVTARLRDDGWGEELEGSRDPWLEGHKSVKGTAKLTDRAWARMRSEIIEHMQGRRTERLQTARRTVIGNRIAHLFNLMKDYIHKCQPQIADFTLMPEFRELLEAHSDTNVDDALAALVSHQIPGLASRWKRERKIELDALVDAARWCGFAIGSDVPGVFVPPISFKCTECDATPIAWPAVLDHPCTRKLRDVPPAASPNNPNALSEELRLKATVGPWSARSLVATAIEASPALEVLIRLCGFDPRRATRADLDESSMRFMCWACLPTDMADGYPTPYTWIQAAEHRLRPATDGTACSCDPGRQAQEGTWYCFDEQVKNGVQELEELGAMFMWL